MPKRSPEAAANPPETAPEPMAAAPVAAADPPAARLALYRRWRAQRFEEILGQEAIVTTLRNAVAGDRVAHAYLFVGPRGTGKTSTARILAKAINCTQRGPDGEPCDRCPACVGIREGRALDVIEIDAASHGLVEDARDLVLRALTAPGELRRRVYIIDEVHMLSAHAFNALLKLIEEPPEHVVFILATTDTHKLPATVVSRTQRFDFRRLPEAVIAGKLARITAAEGATAEPDALALLARVADGGMRDAESLLDQVLAYAGGQVSLTAVQDAVGLADEGSIVGLVDALVAGDAPTALDTIEALADRGREMGQVAAQAEAEARRRLLRAAADPPLARRLAGILRVVGEAASAGAREGRARLALEILAVEPISDLARVTAPAAPSAARAAIPQPTTARAEMAAAPVAPERPSPDVALAEAGPPPADLPDASPPAEPALDMPMVEEAGLAAIRGRWGEIVERAAPAIKPLLRECRPVAVDGPRLTLAFPEERGFMRTKVTARAAAIEQLLAAVLGGTWAIECIAGSVELEPLSVDEALAPASAADPQQRAFLDKVLRITGGELLDVPEVSSR